MRFLNSLILSFCLVMPVYSQDGQPVTSFLESLKDKYPEFNLIYMNDNLQVKSFVVAKDQIVIHNVQLNSDATQKKCVFYLLDNQTNTFSDTLNLEDIMFNPVDRKDLQISLGNKTVYFRPSHGVLQNSEQEKFFRSLSIKIPLTKNAFNSMDIVHDKDDDKDDPFIHFKKRDYFERAGSRNKISLQVNGSIERSYKHSETPESAVPKTLQKWSNFPYVINSKGLIVLDAVKSELIMTDGHNTQYENIELPPEWNKMQYGSELLYDESNRQLYLRLSFENSEKIYWLYQNKFVPSRLKLPGTWDRDGNGLNRQRHMYIDSGKLYVVLNVVEGDKTYDGIFFAYL